MTRDKVRKCIVCLKVVADESDKRCPHCGAKMEARVKAASQRFLKLIAKKGD